VGGALDDLLEAPTRCDPVSLVRHAGAFVTLHRRGELRGCIGHVEADQPLVHVVFRCAVAAATDDQRFAAITAAELADVDIEISIMGAVERISTLSEIVIGRHGLLVERDRHRGLLLPQVAVEQGWAPDRFLSETCRKAGLPDDAWQREAGLWRFEAEVFGER
jgi:AmmeMemoRadiSam system protein A